MSGRTEHYRTFLETWARHCGAPASVFRGQFDVTLAAELEAALGYLAAEQMPDVLAAARRVLDHQHRTDDGGWSTIGASFLDELARSLQAYEDALERADYGRPHG